MIIDFDRIETETIPNFVGGEGSCKIQRHLDENGKIMRLTLPPGGTIGLHTHETSSEMIYFISGNATIIYDDNIEYCGAGCCHYCPKGHSHSVQNHGSDNLIFFAVVANQ